MSLDAIIRTVRPDADHPQRLLEWNRPATRNARAARNSSARFQAMWIAPLIVQSQRFTLASSKPAVLSVAGPMLALWFASPAIAWWISLPLARREASLTADQTLFSPAAWPARPGRSSRPSSAPKTIGCRRTTIKSIRWPGSPIAPRRPTWACRCWRIWPRTISATFQPGAGRTHGECLAHHGSSGALPRALLQLVRHAIS